MNRRIFLLRLLTLTTALGMRARRASLDGDATGVNTLTEQQTRLDQALKRGDLKTYGSLLAPDYIATNFMGKRLTRTGELADLRQEKRLGRSLGYRAWFLDMGFKDLPQDVHITPMKIRQTTLDGEQGLVIVSAKMEFMERIAAQDHSVELIHTDTFLWRETPQGWRLMSQTSTPQALRDGKPDQHLMIWLPERGGN